MIASLLFIASCFESKDDSNDSAHTQPKQSEKSDVVLQEAVPLYTDPQKAAKYNSGEIPFLRFGQELQPIESLPSCFDELILIQSSVKTPEWHASTFRPIEDCLNSSDIARSGDWNFECRYEVGFISPLVENGIISDYARIGTCAAMTCSVHRAEEDLQAACDPLRESSDVYHCEKLKSLNTGLGAGVILQETKNDNMIPL